MFNSKRRKQAAFTAKAQAHLWEQAQFELIGVLHRATTFDERAAEGHILNFLNDEADDGRMMPGYMVLTPTELLWAYADPMQIQRTSIEDEHFSVLEMDDFGPEGWAMVALMGAEDVDPFFAELGGRLLKALRERAEMEFVEPASPSLRPDWYLDPLRSATDGTVVLRYFDGDEWTGQLLETPGTHEDPPGWYPDEAGEGLRYWDGSGWTDETIPFPEV